MKQGDRNTKKFHSTLKWRRARNELHDIVENGQWCVDKEVVKDKVRDFFKSRFVGEEDFQIRMDNVSFNSIFGEDNKMLVGDFSEEEIKEATV